MNPVEPLLDSGVERFREAGYLVVPSILDEASTQQIVERASAMLSELATLPEPQPFVDYEAEIDPALGHHALRRVSRVFERVEAFREVATNPTVCAWARALVGDAECELCLNRHNMMIVKPAHYGSENVWHADAGSWLNDRLVSFMFMLDPATRSNGCLEVVPGSHRSGIPHEGHGHLDLTDPQNASWVQGSIAVEMEPGDGLFFHACLLHYSAANRSTQSRRNLIFAYAPRGAAASDRHRDALETVPL